VLVDFGAAVEEELAQLLGVKRIIALPVKSQSNSAARIEPRRRIVEEKRPLFRSPKCVAFVPVEANHERCNEVELPVKSRQWLKCIDARDHALESERVKHFTEHRNVFDIEPESAMTQLTTNVKEVASSRSKIENAFASPPIELQFLHPAQIDCHPGIQIEILSPASARIIDCIAIVNRLELHGIYVRDDFIDIEVENEPSGQKDTTEVTSHARHEPRVCQFFELV